MTMHNTAKKYAITSQIEAERKATGPIVGPRGDGPHSPEKLISEMRARMSKWYPDILQLQTRVNIPRVQPPRLPPKSQLALRDAPTGTSLSRQLKNPADVLVNSQTQDYLLRVLASAPREEYPPLKKGRTFRTATDASSMTASTDSDESDATPAPQPPSTRRSTPLIAQNLTTAITAAQQSRVNALSPPLEARTPTRPWGSPPPRMVFTPPPRTPTSTYQEPSMATFKRNMYRDPAPYGMSRRTPRRLLLQNTQEDPASRAHQAARSMVRLAQHTDRHSNVVAVVHGFTTPPLLPSASPATSPRPARRKLGREIVKANNKARGITTGRNIVEMHNATRNIKSQ